MSGTEPDSHVAPGVGLAESTEGIGATPGVAVGRTKATLLSITPEILWLGLEPAFPPFVVTSP